MKILTSISLHNFRGIVGRRTNFTLQTIEEKVRMIESLKKQLQVQTAQFSRVQEQLEKLLKKKDDTS